MKPKKRMADGLLKGLQEAVAIEKGQLKAKTNQRELPGPAPEWTDKQIRKLRVEELELSQIAFAILLNVTASTVRSWEQGQKTPSGSAARLLEIFAKDQGIVEKLIA